MTERASNLTVTERAAEMIRRIRSERPGTLTITIDSGCCEGTAPNLYENYLVPYGFAEIGRAEGIPVLVPASWKEQWLATPVTLDLIDDDSSDAMSLETEHGFRFFLWYR